ncbi:MAG: hypothetical protein Hyperionvirus2_181 [Hyperionvirus sp.]|uniref:Uncharacterized protein n=1 Tax=Hyperionvirus sp. TaxID=2487770 RepID=A0A3G5AAE4_9VIRU|nr:MAG: hypothetical protein Hyperionvirus2_181 [Hyperionvirus sp.]
MIFTGKIDPLKVFKVLLLAKVQSHILEKTMHGVNDEFIGFA